MVRVVPPSSWLPGEAPFPIRNGLMISWTRESHRCAMTGRCFNLNTHYVFSIGNSNLPQKAARHIVSAFETLWILYRKRPETVFLMNMPPLLLISAALYFLPNRIPFVLDCHSRSFDPNAWPWFKVLYRWFTRKALFNINHNENDRVIVEKWGGNSYLIPEIPGDLGLENRPLRDLPRPNAVFVSSFADDEPLAAFFDAAARLGNVQFYVTGDQRKCPPDLLAKKPDNVAMTGFISRDEYLSLVASTMAIITLTTRPGIMQMAAEEAICLGVPLVTTDWPVMRDSFAGGGVFTDNSADDIAGKIRRVLDDWGTYRSGMLEQRDKRRALLREKLHEIAEFYRAQTAHA